MHISSHFLSTGNIELCHLLSPHVSLEQFGSSSTQYSRANEIIIPKVTPENKTRAEV